MSFITWSPVKDDSELNFEEVMNIHKRMPYDWKERVAIVEGRREALRVEGEKSSILVLFHSQFIAGAALD